MNAIYGGIWLFALWKWGDWKNWQKYYATILFFLLGDFMYQFFLSDYYPMWKYHPQGVDESAGLTHTHIVLSIMLVKYPATILIYLSKYPNGRLLKKISYAAAWVLLYAVKEIIDMNNNLINYYNGWNLWWSIIFSTVMFTLLRVHYKNPLVAWALSIGFIVILWNLFDVPSSVFR